MTNNPNPVAIKTIAHEVLRIGFASTALYRMRLRATNGGKTSKSHDEDAQIMKGQMRSPENTNPPNFFDPAITEKYVECTVEQGKRFIRHWR